MYVNGTINLLVQSKSCERLSLMLLLLQYSESNLLFWRDEGARWNGGITKKLWGSSFGAWSTWFPCDISVWTKVINRPNSPSINKKRSILHNKTKLPLWTFIPAHQNKICASQFKVLMMPVNFTPHMQAACPRPIKKTELTNPGQVCVKSTTTRPVLEALPKQNSHLIHFLVTQVFVRKYWRPCLCYFLWIQLVPVLTRMYRGAFTSIKSEKTSARTTDFVTKSHPEFKVPPSLQFDRRRRDRWPAALCSSHCHEDRGWSTGTKVQ